MAATDVEELEGCVDDQQAQQEEAAEENAEAT